MGNATQMTTATNMTSATNSWIGLDVQSCILIYLMNRTQYFENNYGSLLALVV
jgi:hypothetical protein